MPSHHATKPYGYTKMLDKILKQFYITICHIRLNNDNIKLSLLDTQINELLIQIKAHYQSNITVANDLSYCLLAAIDEALMSHPDIYQSKIMNPYVTLRFKDGHYGINTYKIFKQCENYPNNIRNEIAIIFYTIMSLGFSGQYNGNQKETESIRHSLFKHIRLAEYDDADEDYDRTKNHYFSSYYILPHLALVTSTFAYAKIGFLNSLFVNNLIKFIKSHLI